MMIQKGLEVGQGIAIQDALSLRICTCYNITHCSQSSRLNLIIWQGK